MNIIFVTNGKLLEDVSCKHIGDGKGFETYCNICMPSVKKIESEEYKLTIAKLTHSIYKETLEIIKKSFERIPAYTGIYSNDENILKNKYNPSIFIDNADIKILICAISDSIRENIHNKDAKVLDIFKNVNVINDYESLHNSFIQTIYESSKIDIATLASFNTLGKSNPLVINVGMGDIAHKLEFIPSTNNGIGVLTKITYEFTDTFYDNLCKRIQDGFESIVKNGKGAILDELSFENYKCLGDEYSHIDKMRTVLNTSINILIKLNSSSDISSMYDILRNYEKYNTNVFMIALTLGVIFWGSLIALAFKVLYMR